MVKNLQLKTTVPTSISENNLRDKTPLVVYGTEDKKTFIKHPCSLICVLDITDISKPTTIFAGNTKSIKSTLKGVVIDGVHQDLDKLNKGTIVEYQFTTVGTHIVKLTLDFTEEGGNQYANELTTYLSKDTVALYAEPCESTVSLMPAYQDDATALIQTQMSVSEKLRIMDFYNWNVPNYIGNSDKRSFIDLSIARKDYEIWLPKGLVQFFQANPNEKWYLHSTSTQYGGIIYLHKSESALANYFNANGGNWVFQYVEDYRDLDS